MRTAPEFRSTYAELRRLAGAYVGRQPAGQTLQPTALVHEAYLRLVPGRGRGFRDRTHFVAVAARAMRQILVDAARKRRTAKRDAKVERITWDLTAPPRPSSDVDVLDFDAALERLHRLDERKARVVELRVFGGLTIDETASSLGVSGVTVSNDWRFARAWFVRELQLQSSC